MKTKKHRNRSVPNPAARYSGYEPSFKRSVILYAEHKSNQEARKRFGISEDTIKRWRKMRNDIMEKAQQCIRRSQRHSMGHGSFSESGPSVTKKEKSIEKEKISEEKDASKQDLSTDLDSMPLQQRLSQNHNEPAPSIQPQETVLQSQPISPTKLKVTRQGKPQQPPPKAPTPPPPPPPQVCLKWNSHHVNMQSAFPNLLTKEQYVDATLFSEGKTLKCHRMILSSCSPYFEEVLNGIGPFQHPVLFMKDIPFWILKALCDFMYAGEVHILQDRLQELLNVANVLKIKGLVGSSGSNEEVKPVVPEIKQELDATPPPRTAVKEEREEEPPQVISKPTRHEPVISKPTRHEPVTSKPTRHEPVKPSKKKEDKKSKHASQTPKAPVEEPPPPPPPPKAAPKVVPKVVAKVVLPKPAPNPRAAVKNIIKNALKPISRPSTSKATHTSRRSDTSRKADKYKAEIAVQKEKEKEKEKPALKKDNINDPLDLLQPVYEEIAKEDPPKVVKSISPGRGNVQVKKGVNKKVKKRRYAEYAEEREESPPPLFHSRKGTRSRPNVKIPKFFHTHYDDSPKETTDATIVRVPHTDQNDPLIGVEVEEIKAEPLDMEENTLDVEENLVNFMVQDPEISQEDEEIIGNYDSPLVNIKREPKSNTPNIFKKVLSPQPVIVDIHTVTESGVRLLDIKEENVQIVDISKISTAETIIGFDTAIVPPQAKPSEIIISSVQSMAELSEEVRLSDRDKHVQEESVPDRRESEAVLLKNDDYPSVGVRPLDTLISPPRPFATEENPQTDPTLAEEVVPPSEPDPLASVAAQESDLPDHQASAMETDEGALQIKIENVRSEEPPHSPPNGEITECVATSSLGSLPVGVETLALESEGGSGYNQTEDDVMGVSSGSLGSLEAKIGTFVINSQEALSSQEMQQDTEAPSDSGCALEMEAESEEVVPENTLQCPAEPLEAVPENTLQCPAEPLGAVPENTLQCPAESLEAVLENTLQCPAEPLEAACEDVATTAALENNYMPEKMETASEEDVEVPTSAPEFVISAPTEAVLSPPRVMNTSEATAADELEPEVLPIAQQPLEVAIPVPEPCNGENAVPDAAASSEQVESNETEHMVVSQQSDDVCVADEAGSVEAPSETINDLDAKLEEAKAAPETAATNTDSTDNIEAELEQCLASTSNIVPPKLTERTPPGDEVQRFTFEDDDEEDFTKDIELPGFIGSGPKPVPYLEDDFTNDFDMEEFPEAKNVPSVEPKTEGGPDEVIEEKAPEEIGTRDNGTRTNDDGCREKNETATEDKDKDDKEEPLEGKEPIKPTIEENNIDAKIPNNIDPTRTEDVVAEEAGENLHLVSEVASPKAPSDKQEEGPTSYEEEQRLEESLLADLDDDIVMKDATTSQEDDDGTEKTLEMIVNDLNESLGEMRK